MQWARDGTKLYFVESFSGAVLMLDLEEGRTRRVWTRRSEGMSVSADGRWLAVSGDRSERGLWIVGTSGGRPTRLRPRESRAHSPRWHPKILRLFYVGNEGGLTGVWSLDVDPETGRASAPPEPVLTGLALHAADIHVVRGGTALVVRSRADMASRLRVRFDARALVTGQPRSTGSGDEIRIEGTRLARGGRWIAWIRGDTHNEIVVAHHREGKLSSVRVVTSSPSVKSSLHWSLDGRRLGWAAGDPEPGVWKSDIATHENGAPRPDPPELLHRCSALPTAGPIWSPDGERVAWCEKNEGCVVAPSEGGAVRPLAVNAAAGLRVIDWSDDGAHLLGEAGGLVLVDVETGRATRWRDSGRLPHFIPGYSSRVLFVEDRTLMATSLESGQTEVVYDARPSSIISYDVDEAAKWIWLDLEASRSEIWELEIGESGTDDASNHGMSEISTFFAPRPKRPWLGAPRTSWMTRLNAA